MTLLWLQVLIAETDLGLATIHGVIVIVELVETRGTETCRVGGTETELTWGIHQGHLRGEVIIERLVMCQSQTEGGGEVFQELHLVLGIGCEGIDLLIDVTRGGCEMILSPVGTEDGGAVGGESQDGLDLTVHHALLL